MSLDVYLYDENDQELYRRNITHNLSKMADVAGVYQYAWRPDELGITRASELVEPLQVGIAKLTADPVEFKQYNPENGWGSYEGLVQFLVEYLEACQTYPDARVEVSR